LKEKNSGRTQNVVKVIVKVVEGKGLHCKRKQWNPTRWHRSLPVFVSKGLYKMKGQMAGKIWAVFAGWTRVIDKFLSYNVGHSAMLYVSSQVFYLHV
jgi:hypothetical protein